MKWAWQMRIIKWPKWIDDPPQPKPESKIDRAKIKVTYINHSTLLIQTDGINILTDPVWAKRAGPFGFIGPKRVRNPGTKLEDLPRIDVILMTHDHYDHLDYKTLKEICRTHRPVILTGLGMKSLLKPAEFPNVMELDWWQGYALPSSRLQFIFVPAKHYSGRTLVGNNRTLWGGFIIESIAGRIYYAGDTGYDELFSAIKSRFGEFALTLLPLGSYEKRWYMKSQHMNPEDAVKVHILLNSKQSMGFHYATFNEHPEQAIDAHEKDLAQALQKYNLPASSFWILGFGEGRYLE